MAMVAEAIQREAEQAHDERLALTLIRYRALDGAALAGRLDALDAARWDCAVVVGAESEAALGAMARLAQRGIAPFTLVSDMPRAVRHGFVGIDNRAAGRTAAALLGRFCGGRGRVGVIAGALDLRDHRERLEGFAAVLAEDFPAMTLVPPREGRDEAARTAAAARRLLHSKGGLAGLYNLGAGNGALLAALRETGAVGRVRVIAHDLGPSSRLALREGAFDAVLDQNPAAEVSAAIALARAVRLGGPAPAPAPIAIALYLRDNLPYESRRA